ncbi:MAG: phosphatase PAP2 family protein [Oscillospiraceae bacterium]
MLNFIQSIDWSILYWIQDRLKCAFLDSVMPAITALGSAGIVWILSGFALLAAKKYRRHGFYLLLGLLMGLVIGNLCLKPLVARPRPCWLDSSIHLLVSSPSDYSFPSGHTLASTIGAVVLARADKRFSFIAIPLALLIALSRLYLFVHFPSDVFAGAILGIVIGFSAPGFGNWLLLRFSALRRRRGG